MSKGTTFVDLFLAVVISLVAVENSRLSVIVHSSVDVKMPSGFIHYRCDDKKKKEKKKKNS
jgi:hypothetical protein